MHIEPSELQMLLQDKRLLLEEIALEESNLAKLKIDLSATRTAIEKERRRFNN